MRFYSFDKDNSIVNLSNSILKKYGVQPFHSTIKQLDDLIKDKKKLCLVLLDGFGVSVQDRYLDKNHPFIKNRLMQISSMFPPTTVAATTALRTGKYNGETGWIAWTTYVKEVDSVVEMFTKKDYVSKEKIVPPDFFFKKYPVTSIFSLIKEKNPTIYCDQVEHGDFSDEAYDTSDEMFVHAHEELDKFDEGFLFVYDMEPDHEFHHSGLSSDCSRDLALYLVDKTLDLIEKHKDTFFVVISDHSHIETDPIYVEDYPDVSALINNTFILEGRAASFKVKKGCEKQFLELANKYWSEDFDIVDKKYMIENHLFGYGKYVDDIEEILGDYTLIAVTNKYFKVVHEENIRPPLKSNHGGGTKEENMIALVTFNGDTAKKY